MKYYFISGERSGDLHASNLVKSIKEKDPQAVVRAVGGSYLEQAGAEISVDYTEVSFMGFFEVFKNLGKISEVMKRVKNGILTWKPDVIVLVDFGGFNLRMAKFLKENNFKVFYYISPKIWAWKQNRALVIKKYVDRTFVILPFEKDFFKKFDHEVDYVGNPVLDAINSFKQDQNFLQEFKLENKKIIALLPGSRKQEVEKILSLMYTVANQFQDYHFVVAGVSNLPKELYEKYQSDKISIVYDRSYDVLINAKAAVVTSGTATLETALLKIPQVVVYRTNVITYHIAKNLIKVLFISLVNLIAGKEVVKELIQKDYNAEEVAANLNKILSVSGREEVLKGYREISEILGDKNASSNTAALMINYLQKS